MFAYTLAPGLFAHAAVLTAACDQRLVLIPAISSPGLGMLWGVFDWVYEQFVRPNVILGKTDTILDLVAAARESLAAGYVCLRMLAK
jgi:hypothetical protein